MSQDAAINAFTVKSAGTKSVTASISHGSAFIIPVITPVTMPVGPYKLSIQPGSGSFAVAITKMHTKKIPFSAIDCVELQLLTAEWENIVDFYIFDLR